MPSIAPEFTDRLWPVEQPVDQNIGVEERVRHDSGWIAIFTHGALVFDSVADVSSIFPITCAALDPVLACLRAIDGDRFAQDSSARLPFFTRLAIEPSDIVIRNVD